MSNAPKDPQETQADPPSKVKRIIPLVLASSIGLFAGGAAGALIAGPVMAERAVAHAQVVAEQVVGKSAAGGKGGAETDSSGKKDGKTTDAPVYKVENLVLNPAQSGGTRFLVATLALEVADSSATIAMKQRDSEVRDAVLRVLGGRTVVQLSDMAGRSLLKQELQVAVDSVFGKKLVSAVYLPQFVIQ